MTGNALLTITTGRIRASGQPLTVTRPATAQGGSVTTRTVYFLPQPLNATNAAALLLEAGRNAGEGNPYDFVTSGDADVSENDSIAYGGFNWRVLNINPQVLGGVAVTLHCYTERENAS